MSFENKIACAYFPTKVITIDDNAEFSKLLSIKISKTLSAKAFRDPIEALNFLKSNYKDSTFMDRCIKRTEDDCRDHRNIDIDISAIHQEIYNPFRFDETGVIAVDYAMPGINGAEFCHELKGNRYKIVLLTGEAGIETAIQLFNNGIINRYIHKNEPNYLDKLVNSIIELQHEYFTDLSEIIINSLTIKPQIYDQPPSCLVDPTFIKFFNGLIKKYKIIEYYLLDESGSFLFLDENAKLSWLAVRNEEEMHGTDYEINLPGFEAAPNIRKAVKNREVLRYFFNTYDFPNEKDPDSLRRFIYPATKLEGKNNYFYSYIEKPLTDIEIDTDEIVSYSDYKRG